MEHKPDPFQATASWCYRFARYFAIPKILAMPDVASGRPIRLVDFSKKILDGHLSKDQQNSRFKRAKADGEQTVSSSVKFYIPFIAQQTRQLVKLGDGMFRVPTEADFDEEEIEADALDAAVEEQLDEAADLSGWVYAFSFPMIQKSAKPYPIKVGKTANDVESRVTQQCRQSVTFERPVVLGRWKVDKVGPVEIAVHNVLKARGKWREEAPGTEWFDTTISEIDEIIKFVTSK